MGRPPRIERSAVLAAGLAVADARGIDAVTMQAVADRLGVTPMALYRHVADKADLLDGLVELLLTEFALPPAGLAWRPRLIYLAHAIRQTAHRHPAVFPLLLQRPAATPSALAVRNGVYEALDEAGVAADQVAQAERLISTAILGFAVSEVSGRFAQHSARTLDQDFQRLIGVLESFIERCPDS